MLALTTGARKGEILSLTWNCISFERGTIQLKKTKNNHPRSIALVGKTLETLRQLHIEKNPQQEKVFPGKKRFSQLDIRKAWIRACKEAELVDLRLHDLRHNFCTFAAQTGASNLELATAMGHRTLQMLKRYCHLDSKLTKRLSEHVDQLIEEE